jgi:site-specific DNA recombinase
MKYFLYARKSTDSEERQIKSIDDQLAELKEFALIQKIEIAASFTEAKTAKKPGRIVFNQMIKRMEKGEAQGILAWHPDRLARNSIDGGKIIYLLDTGIIHDLKFPTFWFDSTPQGKFMLNIAFGQSKYYVDNLSENIRRGIRQKLKNGLWPSFAPIGYLNNRKTKGIDINPIEALIIKRAFEMYSTGEFTLKGIAGFFAKSNLKSYQDKTLSVSRVQYLLRNSIYCGLIRFNGEYYQGVHEPIISKKLFDLVQEVMNNRGKKQRKRKHEFIFSGLIRCGGCGCLITAETQKGHNYYRCTKKKNYCPEKYLREEELISQIKIKIQKVSLPKDWAKNKLAELDKETNQANIQSQPLIQNLLTQKSEINRKLDDLLNLRLDSLIDNQQYLTKKNLFINQQSAIDGKIADFESKGNYWLEPMKEMILSASLAKILLKKNNPYEFRSFLKNIGSNFVLKDKNFGFQGNTGWRILLNSPTFSDWRRTIDAVRTYFINSYQAIPAYATA